MPSFTGRLLFCKKFLVFRKKFLTFLFLPAILNKLSRKTRTSGGLAQLGERLHGMQEVTGSIPVFSTTKSRNVGCGFFIFRQSISADNSFFIHYIIEKRSFFMTYQSFINNLSSNQIRQSLFIYQHHSIITGQFPSRF